MNTLTTENRTALLAIAETLWTARKALNATDEHGVDALATGYDTGSAYDHTTDALRAVLLPLVGGDESRAAEVLFLLADNYESVAYNLDVEARQHATRHHRTCDACGATVEPMGTNGWVDVVSGDDGGTYDRCPERWDEVTDTPRGHVVSSDDAVCGCTNPYCQV